MILGLIVALLVVVVDQASKIYMMNVVLSDTDVIDVLPFFSLVKAWNTGVSFSMFDGFGSIGVVVLSLVAIFIVAYLSWWLKTEKSKFIQVALGFIIGGAIGNVIDRLRLGAVFDFLDFYIGENHWPAFNVADSFICIGAGMIIFHSLLKNRSSAAGGDA